jgi:hypothetical protein
MSVLEYDYEMTITKKTDIGDVSVSFLLGDDDFKNMDRKVLFDAISDSLQKQYDDRKEQLDLSEILERERWWTNLFTVNKKSHKRNNKMAK